MGIASEAASSLAQMAARGAKSDTALAALVRERQDLVGEWQNVIRRAVLPCRKHRHKRNRRRGSITWPALPRSMRALAEIDKRLAADFPDHAALSSPSRVGREVQAQLRADEALVLFLDTPELKPTPEETFIWVVTKSDMRWVRIELGTKALTERVAALRCGLDQTLWDDDKSAQKCKATLGPRPSMETCQGWRQGGDGAGPALRSRPRTRAVQSLARSGRGHDQGQAPDHRALRPANQPALPCAGHRAAQERDPGQARRLPRRGLARRTSAVSVLPSVASLKALRQFARTRQATKPYLGIGNPLLDGPQDDLRWGAHYKKQAELARTRRCSQISPVQQVASARGPRSVRNFTSVFRGAQADIEHVRQFSPLPETADELCDIARRLGVPESEILLGASATETGLKDLSEQGRLADYAVVHFATHGALAGQVQGSTEPGLVLTPPAKGTSDPKSLERDDGFLTASEIAALKLDADWVILSACNTAGGAGESAEALSGMARAFFYAGARTLLVSHWEVGSDAAVKLSTRAFAELKSNPGMGRAEALRLSMRELIEKGSPAEAHPSTWAPFVVVGEGGGAAETSAPGPAAAAPAQGRHPVMGGPIALVGEGGSSKPPPSVPTQGVTSPPVTSSPVTPSVPPSKAPAHAKAKPATQKGDWKSTIWKDSRP